MGKIEVEMATESRHYMRAILSACTDVQHQAARLGLRSALSRADLKALYRTLVTDNDLRTATEQLFGERHYALAVCEGYKCLNNFVKKKSGSNRDGADLMRSVFSPKTPTLKINDLKSDSQRNQQAGYMDIFAGCMTGIRNPRAHEHKYTDTPEAALEMLACANHLFRVAKTAKRARKVAVTASKPTP
jgi:uncharacterized protein (TIGR02391 family)